jgi:hypothetical protein
MTADDIGNHRLSFSIHKENPQMVTWPAMSKAPLQSRSLTISSTSRRYLPFGASRSQSAMISGQPFQFQKGWIAFATPSRMRFAAVAAPATRTNCQGQNVRGRDPAIRPGVCGITIQCVLLSSIAYRPIRRNLPYFIVPPQK